MAMTKLLICDDNSNDLDELQKIIENFYNENATPYSVIRFSDTQKVLGFVEDGNKVDIAILDVIMPEKNGMELAAEMRNLGFDGFLVFLTSSNDFAAQSYSVKAYSYILKPARKEAVNKILSNIEKLRQENDRNGFTLTRRSGVRFVLYTELMFVEVINHQLLFHLADGEVISIYATLKEYSEMLLSQPQNCRPQKSFIVNLDFVRYFENSAIFMRDETRISVPKDFENLKERWLERMFGHRNW
jgi:DNA-binding LytR/AlgR family response regulator